MKLIRISRFYMSCLCVSLCWTDSIGRNNGHNLTFISLLRIDGTCCNGCTNIIPWCPKTTTMTTTMTRSSHRSCGRRQERPPGPHHHKSNKHETLDHKSNPNEMPHDEATTATRMKVVSKPPATTEPALNRRPQELVLLAGVQRPHPQREEEPHHHHHHHHHHRHSSNNRFPMSPSPLSLRLSPLALIAAASSTVRHIVSILSVGLDSEPSIE